MRRVLLLTGLLICTFTYVFITTVLVWYSDVPEAIANYWLHPTLSQIVFYSVFLIVPAHLWWVIYAVKKESMDWSMTVPFFLIPYMMGAIAQAIVL